ncbi:MAG: hypothetical protein M3450_02785 [Actinomycetota bacterium]|nr:hypothetical protein [Actinomycetota bacterium]MDQ3640411.1 hypothetical protein [Actinomycetota bacterium]
MAAVILVGVMAVPASATVYPNRPETSRCPGTPIHVGVRWDGKPSAAYRVEVFTPPNNYGNRRSLFFDRGYDYRDWHSHRKDWTVHTSSYETGWYKTEIAKFARATRTWVQRTYWTYVANGYC